LIQCHSGKACFVMGFLTNSMCLTTKRVLVSVLIARTMQYLSTSTSFSCRWEPSELTWPVWWVQDDLVQELRLEGRRQAQQRLMRQKREHVCSHSGTPDIIQLEESSS
jgi:hypothetical protein